MVKKTKKQCKNADAYKFAYTGSHIFSGNNIFLNYDNWFNKKRNVLFVLGQIGSGKTTLGKKIALENKAEFIDLDDYHRDSKGNMIKVDWTRLLVKLMAGKRRKVIVGMQILNSKYVLERIRAEKFPVIFVNASLVKSLYQKIKRGDFTPWRTKVKDSIMTQFKDLLYFHNKLKNAFLKISE